MSDGGKETYVIGADEAGYGPNLGPLTVAATVWSVERSASQGVERSASQRLDHSASPRLDGPSKLRTKADPFRRYARRAIDEPDDRPLIDDSKAIYGRGGLAALERAVLAMLEPFASESCGPVGLAPSPAMPLAGASHGGLPSPARRETHVSAPVGLAPPPAGTGVSVDLGGLTSPAQEMTPARIAGAAERPRLSLRRFWRTIVCRGDVDAWEEFFWLREFADALPVAPPDETGSSPAEEPTGGSKKKTRRRGCAAPSVAFRFARAAAVFPESFNRGVEEAGNKASLLTRTTLALIAGIVDDLPPGATVYISADRHGGRKRYRDALQDAFPDALVMTVDESASLSRYRWFRDDATVECEFRVEGDSYVPTALASMTAKYLRELCMAAWNAHWRERRPELRPTAGYPGDARRFYEEIRDLLLADGICDRTVWRRC